ncbi:MAG: trimethylamine methyltransferase family protein [Anaerolineae bacterium]|nr:trimethylamine methyltransferase family protein [Anaerolineae bacterium]
MVMPRYGILTTEEIQRLHEATLFVLDRVGVRVHHEGIVERLAEAGAQVDRSAGLARMGEDLVMRSLQQAGKQFILYGRDGTRRARFGYGDIVTISSPGQYSWVDWRERRRYPPTTRELLQAIRVGDALEHIDIVGAMTQPVDVPEPIRDIYLTAELVKHTAKPARAWIKNGLTARYVLEIYRIVAGGAEALRQRPQVEHFVEPISPLQMPRTGMEILLEFAEAGLPVSIGPMVQASATGPATLAGTLVQENAEILAALVIAQVLRPGTPVMYGGIPHIMDPRTALISFGSPEQALMAVAMVQVAHHYGLPVYVNTGLGDSKVVDVQTGYDRGMTFLMGALAGGDLLGHMGISGADQGASLLQLVADNEMIGYVKRIVRGIDLAPDRLATEVIAEVGPGGNYLGLEHTVRHYREEFWIPSRLWDRMSWDAWEEAGATTMAERAAARLEEILATHELQPIDEAMAREIDRVVAAARRELVG